MPKSRDNKKKGATKKSDIASSSSFAAQETSKPSRLVKALRDRFTGKKNIKSKVSSDDPKDLIVNTEGSSQGSYLSDDGGAVSAQQSNDSVVNRDKQSEERYSSQYYGRKLPKELEGSYFLVDPGYVSGSDEESIHSSLSEPDSTDSNSDEENYALPKPGYVDSRAEKDKRIEEDERIKNLISLVQDFNSKISEQLLPSNGSPKEVVNLLNGLRTSIGMSFLKIKYSVSEDKEPIISRLYEEVLVESKKLESFISTRETLDVDSRMKCDAFVEKVRRVRKEAECSLHILEFLEAMENTNFTEFEKKENLSAEEAVDFLQNSRKEYLECIKNIKLTSNDLMLKTMQEIQKKLTLYIDAAITRIQHTTYTDDRIYDTKEIIRDLRIEIQKILTEERKNFPIAQFLTAVENTNLTEFRNNGYSSAKEAIDFLKKAQNDCKYYMGNIIKCHNESMRDTMNGINEGIKTEINSAITAISKGRNIEAVIYDLGRELQSISKEARSRIHIAQFLTVVENTNLTEFRNNGYSSAEEAKDFLKKAQSSCNDYVVRIYGEGLRDSTYRIISRMTESIKVKFQKANEAISNKGNTEEVIRNLGIELTRISEEARYKLSVVQFVIDIRSSLVEFGSRGYENISNDEFREINRRFLDTSKLCKEEDLKKVQEFSPELSKIFHKVHDNVGQKILKIYEEVIDKDAKFVNEAEKRNYEVGRTQLFKDFDSEVQEILTEAFKELDNLLVRGQSSDISEESPEQRPRTDSVDLSDQQNKKNIVKRLLDGIKDQFIKARKGLDEIREKGDAGISKSMVTNVENFRKDLGKAKKGIVECFNEHSDEIRQDANGKSDTLVDGIQDNLEKIDQDIVQAESPQEGLESTDRATTSSKEQSSGPSKSVLEKIKGRLDNIITQIGALRDRVVKGKTNTEPTKVDPNNSKDLSVSIESSSQGYDGGSKHFDRDSVPAEPDSVDNKSKVSSKVSSNSSKDLSGNTESSSQSYAQVYSSYSGAEQQSNESVVNRKRKSGKDEGTGKIDYNSKVGSTGSSKGYDDRSQNFKQGSVSIKLDSITRSISKGGEIQHVIEFFLYGIECKPHKDIHNSSIAEIFNIKSSKEERDSAFNKLRDDISLVVESTKAANVSKDKSLVVNRLFQNLETEIEKVESFFSTQKDLGSLDKLRDCFKERVRTIRQEAESSLYIIDFLKVMENTNLTEFEKKGDLSAEGAKEFLEASKKESGNYSKNIKDNYKKSNGWMLKTVKDLNEDVKSAIGSAIKSISGKESDDIKNIKKEIRGLGIRLGNISTKARKKIPIAQFLTVVESTNLTAFQDKKKGYSSVQEAKDFLEKAKNDCSYYMEEVARDQDELVLRLMEDLDKNVQEEINNAISSISKAESDNTKEVFRNLDVRLKEISTKAKDRLKVAQFLIDIQDLVTEEFDREVPVISYGELDALAKKLENDREGHVISYGEFDALAKKLENMHENYNKYVCKIEDIALKEIFSKAYKDLENAIKVVDIIREHEMKTWDFVADKRTVFADFINDVQKIVDQKFTLFNLFNPLLPMIEESLAKARQLLNKPELSSVAAVDLLEELKGKVEGHMVCITNEVKREELKDVKFVKIADELCFGITESISTAITKIENNERPDDMKEVIQELITAIESEGQKAFCEYKESQQEVSSSLEQGQDKNSTSKSVFGKLGKLSKKIMGKSGKSENFSKSGDSVQSPIVNEEKYLQPMIEESLAEARQLLNKPELSSVEAVDLLEELKGKVEGHMVCITNEVKREELKDVKFVKIADELCFGITESISTAITKIENNERPDDMKEVIQELITAIESEGQKAFCEYKESQQEVSSSLEQGQDENRMSEKPENFSKSVDSLQSPIVNEEKSEPQKSSNNSSSSTSAPTEIQSNAEAEPAVEADRGKGGAS